MVILTDESVDNDSFVGNDGGTKEKYDDPFLESDQDDRESADAVQNPFVPPKQPPSRDSAGYLYPDFPFLFC